MKTRTLIPLVAMGVIGLSLCAGAEKADPATFCRFVPERSDDFAWENDKIAFRAYGPPFREGTEDSGIDCWLKRVEYPIIDKWYGGMKEKTYHKDWGEGYDPYHVGASRGCGGLGLWLDGELITANTYVDWKVEKNGPKKSVFVLNYAWEHGGDQYKEEKRIAIKLGARLFKASSTFWKNGELAVDLPIAVGLTTHEGKAAATRDIAAGWMACWEKIDDASVGTGVVMDPARIDKFMLVESKKKDESHAFLLTKTDAAGKVEYFAGYGWEKAGAIKTSSEWNAYLAAFRK